jgi:hypothetical protein
MDLERNDQRGDKKLITPLAAKQKGCMNTNKVEEDINERCRKGSKTNTQAHTIRGEEAQTSVEIEEPGVPLTRRTKKNMIMFLMICHVSLQK